MVTTNKIQAKVFRTAWSVFKKGGISFSNALSNAYKLFKIDTLIERIKSNQENNIPFSCYANLVHAVSTLRSQLVSPNAVVVELEISNLFNF